MDSTSLLPPSPLVHSSLGPPKLTIFVLIRWPPLPLLARSNTNSTSTHPSRGRSPCASSLPSPSSPRTRSDDTSTASMSRRRCQRRTRVSPLPPVLASSGLPRIIELTISAGFTFGCYSSGSTEATGPFDVQRPGVMDKLGSAASDIRSGPDPVKGRPANRFMTP